MTEMKLILATLLWKVDISLPEKSTLRGEILEITPLYVQLTPVPLVNLG